VETIHNEVQDDMREAVVDLDEETQGDAPKSLQREVTKTTRIGTNRKRRCPDKAA
jgi:hypothetical protein